MEEKFNFDRSNGHHKYWGNVGHSRRTCYKHDRSWGSFKVWAVFGARANLKICFVPLKMGPEEYVDLLENSLIDFAGGLYSDIWRFQQDTATIHVAWLTGSIICLKMY